MTASNANEGGQAGAVLESLVVKPPAESATLERDARDLLQVRADGAYSNESDWEWAAAAGFRRQPPWQGHARRRGQAA